MSTRKESPGNPNKDSPVLLFIAQALSVVPHTSMADGVKSPAAEVYQPPADIQKVAHVSSMDQYKKMHKRSIEDPVGFWGDIAKDFYWKTPPNPDTFLEFNFDVSKGPISIKWMQGAVTNVCYNMLDRHVENGLGDKVAFFW